MAITSELLEKPALTSLRERFLQQKLVQVELAYASRSDELERLRNSTLGLSPAKIDQSQFELDALRDLKANLLDGLRTVARQRAAALAPGPVDDDEGDQAIGPWRKQSAYFEVLQRERAKLTPLSRDQFGRAKAVAAKRTRKGRAGVGLDSEQLNRMAHPTWYTQPGAVRSYMFAKQTLTGVDPCVDAKRTRREVMFAQRTAGIGYRVRHEWKPC